MVSTAYFPLSFHGTNVFSFNQGPSLAVVGSRVRLYGSLRFSSNSNTGSLDGGALYLTSLGQLELAEDASLSFINNSGTLVAIICTIFTDIIWVNIFSVLVQPLLFRTLPFVPASTLVYSTILCAL